METLTSKDQNAINSFKAAAYAIVEYEVYGGNLEDCQTSRQTMRLAYWMMGLEAQRIAYNWYIENINPVWMAA